MDLSMLLTLLGTLGIGGAVGGVGVAIVRRGPEKLSASAAFQEALNGTAKAFSEATTALIAVQNTRIEEQGALIRELDTRHQKDRQEVHQLRNEVQSRALAERACEERAARCESRCEELEARLSGIERSIK